jgi:hypothetical protein
MNPFEQVRQDFIAGMGAMPAPVVSGNWDTISQTLKGLTVLAALPMPPAPAPAPAPAKK